jgi:general secretion pathway protein D
VVPRINSNGKVLLDVEQEISNVANNNNTGTLTPTLSQRKVKSGRAASASNRSMSCRALPIA